jgi:UDP-glucose 4-epimerase
VDLANKMVVVTGGAGFIASHVVDALVARSCRVVVVDDFSTGREEFLNKSPNVRLVRGDLLDQKTVDGAVAGSDFVFHFAANADIKDGLSHPRKDVEQNIIVTQNVLEAMRANGVKNIAFASTGSVYGEPEIFPTPETCPFPVQTSLYATSKVAAEGLLSSYAGGYGFRTWIFRFVSMLGPRYTHGHVIDFWRKLRRDPTRLEVLGNGFQRKAYCHVLDCVSAIFTVIDKCEDPVNIYNLGHTDTLVVNQSIGIISRELGVSPKLEYTGGARGWVGDSPLIMLDTAKLRALGWAPTYSLEAAIIDTLRFLEQNPHLAEK